MSRFFLERFAARHVSVVVCGLGIWRGVGVTYRKSGSPVVDRGLRLSWSSCQSVVAVEMVRNGSGSGNGSGGLSTVRLRLWLACRWMVREL